MLVAFYGPSAVGKSAVMETLNRKYSWNFVRVLTTRPNRPDEREKINVSIDEFNEQSRNRKLIFENVFFGNHYGLISRDFHASLSDNDDIWMLDFSITERRRLLQYDLLEVFLVPNSEDQLVRQAKVSGRSERISLIIYEYKNFYLKLIDLRPEIDPESVFVSAEGKIEYTADLVLNYIATKRRL